jgi:hypothetical protein
VTHVLCNAVLRKSPAHKRGLASQPAFSNDHQFAGHRGPLSFLSLDAFYPFDTKRLLDTEGKRASSYVLRATLTSIVTPWYALFGHH